MMLGALILVFDYNNKCQSSAAMKNSELGNRKITDYMSNKGIPPLARILNSSTLSTLAPTTKPTGNRGIVKERERIQIQFTDQIEIDKQNQTQVCKQLIMIGPLDTRYSGSTNHKLRVLYENYNKQDFIKFVLHNAKFHNINNLSILQSVGDQVFWNKTVPKMVQYALAKEKQQSISCRVPTLPAQTPRIIEVTRAQVLMILINMFFCTLPWQTFRQYLSFSSLMSVKEKDRQAQIKVKAEKLKCFINYFKIAIDDDYQSLSKETVNFQRVSRVLKHEDLFGNTSSLAEVEIRRGLIEDEYKNGIMVDFANKNIGGGVLNNGAVQEEILFCVFPELVTLICLCEQLGEQEAVIISGVRKINRYTGYSDQFKYEGTFQEDGSKYKHPSIIVAIDAIDFSEKICNGQSQYTSTNIQRQISKALAGIQGAELLASYQMSVCTGRWGCGAFRGDPYLKFLIQLLACSIAKRKMVYMAQSNEEENELKVMTKYLRKHDVSEIIESITQFNTVMKKNKKTTFLTFFKQFIV